MKMKLIYIQLLIIVAFIQIWAKKDETTHELINEIRDALLTPANDIATETMPRDVLQIYLRLFRVLIRPFCDLEITKAEIDGAPTGDHVLEHGERVAGNGETKKSSAQKFVWNGKGGKEDLHKIMCKILLGRMKFDQLLEHYNGQTDAIKRDMIDLIDGIVKQVVKNGKTSYDEIKTAREVLEIRLMAEYEKKAAKKSAHPIRKINLFLSDTLSSIKHGFVNLKQIWSKKHKRAVLTDRVAILVFVKEVMNLVNTNEQNGLIVKYDADAKKDFSNQTIKKNLVGAIAISLTSMGLAPASVFLWFPAVIAAIVLCSDILILPLSIYLDLDRV